MGTTHEDIPRPRLDGELVTLLDRDSVRSRDDADDDQVWGRDREIPAATALAETPLQPLCWARWRQSTPVSVLVVATLMESIATILRVRYSVGAGKGSAEWTIDYSLGAVAGVSRVCGITSSLGSPQLIATGTEVRVAAQTLAAGGRVQVFASLSGWGREPA